MYEDYEDLVERLRECTAEQNGEKTLWYQAADAIDNLLYICKHQATEIRELKNQWIPVAERLPNPKDLVLVCNEFGGVHYGYFESNKQWYTANNWLVDAWTWMPNVTHWMPLPSAPMEE